MNTQIVTIGASVYRDGCRTIISCVETGSNLQPHVGKPPPYRGLDDRDLRGQRHPQRLDV